MVMQLNIAAISLLTVIAVGVGEQPAVAQGWVAPDPEPLFLNATRGYAPFSVRVVGPPKFYSTFSNWHGHYGFGNPGWGIDWGDGAYQPGRQEESRQTGPLGMHTYTVPGTYKVRATIVHLGPTDRPIYDWIGENTVTVYAYPGKKPGAAGPVAATGIALDVLQPRGGTYTYEVFPDVQWKLTTDRKVNLKVELVDQQNQVVTFGFEKQISYNKPSEQARFSARSYDGYDKALMAGRNSFRYLVTAQAADGSRRVVKSSPWFKVTRDYVPVSEPLRIVSNEPSDNSASVVLEYIVNHPGQFSYILDWGDSSVERGSTVGSTLLVRENRKFRHTYSRPGRYKVVLRSNNLDPFKKVEDIAFNETVTVDVKATGPQN